MIAEFVEFDLPAGTTRDEALALYRQTAVVWVENQDLLDKYYVFDEARGIGGGVYIWRSREAAERFHCADYRRMIHERYGSEPRIRILDAILRVEPESRRITEC